MTSCTLLTGFLFGSPKPVKYVDIRRTVARALEYYIGDASIALTGKQPRRTEEYNYFMKRA